MADVLEFTDLFQECKGAMYPGRLKMQITGLVYKNQKTGKVDQYPGSDIGEAQWINRSKGKCLRILTKGGFSHVFDGFRESDHERLNDFMSKHYGVSLESKESSVKGWNWGRTNFNANTLEFLVDGVPSFEIPLSNVSHSRLNKSEVTLEFHRNDDAPVAVVETTFYSLNLDSVEELHKNVMSRADILQITGDAITIFNEIQCLTPRGRYDIKIYPTFFQLHGKTFDYKIPYRTILRLFLLPHRDGRQYYFMVSLDPPIKQGQTRYHFLVLLFSKEVEMTLELSLSEEELEKKYEGKLKKEMGGPEHEVVSQIIRVLVNKKITTPGSFMGHTKTHSLGCSYKAATGYLYPLDRGFAYVYKPPIYLRFDEITSVNFGRSAGSTRSFDFDVETTNGVVYNFVGIEKEEYGQLFDFVKNKNLRMKNVDKGDVRKVPQYRDDMEESGDEDRVHNAYVEKMKTEGKGRDANDGDDDEDESDESFKPDDAESEPDDEYDSQHESEDSEGDSEPKKKKRKVDKEEKMDVDDSGKSDVGEDGDEEEEEERKDKKKKKKEEKKEKKVKETKKSDKKQKKEKDANKPKKGRTAYFVWLAEVRDKLKSEFPGISVTELTKKAGERWREVKDKSKWEKVAAEEKVVYEDAMAVYKREGGGGGSSSTNKDSKKSKQLKKTDSVQSSQSFKSKEFISDEDSNKGNSDDSD